MRGSVLRWLLWAAAATGSAGAGADSVWTPAPCSSDDDAKAAAIEVEVRGAGSDSSMYVPKPYPTVVAEAFQDFTFQYLESWSTQSTDLVPAEEKPLLALVQGGLLAPELLVGADWRPSRCGALYGTRDRFLLLRLRRASDQVEVARVVLQPSGLIASLRTTEMSSGGFALTDGHQLESLDVAQAAANARDLGFEVAQYVAISSPSLRCPDANPCIVFRDGDRVFLYRAGKVLELRYQTDRFSNREFVQESAERDQVSALLGPGRHVVSLGGDELTLAEEVPLPGPTP